MTIVSSRLSSRAAATLVASLLLAGSAFAQTPATPAAPAAPATSAAPAAKTDSAKPHSAASIECSKEADAKGLHGKERHKFRSKCKEDAKKN